MRGQFRRGPPQVHAVSLLLLLSTPSLLGLCMTAMLVATSGGFGRAMLHCSSTPASYGPDMS